MSQYIISHYPGLSRSVSDHVFNLTRKQNLPINKAWKDYLKSLRTPKKIPKIDGKHSTVVKNTYFVFDLMAVALEQYQLLLLFKRLLNEDFNEDFLNSEFTICAKLVLDIKAVRLLTSVGMDTQARVVARCVSENIDALSLACINEQFCKDFVSSSGDDESKNTWFKYMSKGKSRNRIFAQLANTLDQNSITSIKDYIKQEEDSFSLAAHPSHVSGIMSFWPTLADNDENNHEINSHNISRSALRTLKFVATRISHFFFFDHLDFGVIKKVIEIPHKDESPLDDSDLTYVSDVSNMVLFFSFASQIIWHMIWESNHFDLPETENTLGMHYA